MSVPGTKDRHQPSRECPGIPNNGTNQGRVGGFFSSLLNRWLRLLSVLTRAFRRTYVRAAIHGRRFQGSLPSLALLLVMHFSLTVSFRADKRLLLRVMRLYFMAMFVPAAIVYIQYRYQHLAGLDD